MFADNIFTGTRRVLAERSVPYFCRRFFCFLGNHSAKESFLRKVTDVLFQCKRESKEIPDIFSDDVEQNKINRL